MRATPRPHPKRLVLRWVGHSSTVLDLDGVRVLTDPLLRGRVAHLVWTGGRPPPVPQAGADVVLVSHAHRDHLDVPSLRALPRGTPCVVPRGAGQLLRRAGIGEVVEVVEGDVLRFGEVRVRATRAVHGRGRDLPFRGPQPLGYLIEGSLSVYFAGDTDLFPELSGLRPGLDLALLPVGGWGSRVPAGHLDPARAADAAALLSPRVAVPIHWGTLRPFYRGSAYPSDTVAAGRFAELVAQRAAHVRVEVLAPGGLLELAVLPAA